MLYAYFDQPTGHIIYKGCKERALICKGNCLFVVVSEEKHNLLSFFSDMDHLKACLKDGIFNTVELPIDYIELDINYSPNLQIAKHLVKFGYEVRLVNYKKSK